MVCVLEQCKEREDRLGPVHPRVFRVAVTTCYSTVVEGAAEQFSVTGVRGWEPDEKELSVHCYVEVCVGVVVSLMHDESHLPTAGPCTQTNSRRPYLRSLVNWSTWRRCELGSFAIGSGRSMWLRLSPILSISLVVGI